VSEPTLCFFAAPAGGAGVVVEVSPPGADGRIRLREWNSAAGESSATVAHTSAAELERRMREWQRAGWTLGESPDRVMGWLKAHGL
jgi:hypothetical protein